MPFNLSALAGALPGALVPRDAMGAAVKVNPAVSPELSAILAQQGVGSVPARPTIAVASAKPVFGTPPFAPPPANTGGAEPPAQVKGGLAAAMMGQYGQQPAARPKGFMGFMDRVVHPSNPLGEFGRAMLMASGGPIGDAFRYMELGDRQKRAEEQDRNKVLLEATRYDQERADKLEDRDYERNKPQYFSGNEDRVMLDPATGTTKVLYDAPTPAEAYAKSLGLDATDDAGHRAIQDYVLRGSGPTALEGDLTLEDARFGHRAAIRGMPTFAQAQRASAPGSLAGPRRARSRSASAPRRARGGYPEGTVIRNAAGQRMVRRGGQWVAM